MKGIVMNVEKIKEGYLLTWNPYQGKEVEKQFFKLARELINRIAEIIGQNL